MELSRYLVAEDLRCGRLLPKSTPRSSQLSGVACWLALSAPNVVGMEFVVTIESLVRRLSVPIIVFFLTLASAVASVHAAENPRKITVVSFGLFGDQGVFRREEQTSAHSSGT